MYLWLEIFLISTGITARLIIPASTCGSGVNLLVVIFIWLALFVRIIEKSKLTAVTPTLPRLLKLVLFLFISLIIASFINAPYKFGGFQYLVAWISDIVLFYLVYSLCVRDTKYITTLLSVFLSTALIIVLYALYQHFWELRGLAEQIQQNPSLLDMVPVDLRGAFLARALAAEPFATFTYQNSLGAFMALIIPLFIALVIIRQKRWLISGIGVLVMLFVLVKTGSKGAIVALILGYGGAWIIYYFFKVPSIMRGFRSVLLLGCVIIAIILLVFISHSQMSDSLNVRLGYWDATVKIIRDNPVNGVGLNQFGNSYLYYKSADAGEVLKAHNDYLQMASEMGIPALLVFLAIWFIILKSIFRPARQVSSTYCNTEPRNCHAELGSASPETLKRVQGDTEKKDSSLPYILGAGFAFLISELFQTPLIALDIPLLSTIIIFILWIFIFRFLSGYLTTNILDTNILRIGLFAGLLAFLIHCAGDFNLYVQGFSMSVWFVGAIFLSTAEPGAIPIMSAAVKKIINGLAIILIVGVIGILSILTMKFVRYDPFASLSEQQAKEPIVAACFPPAWNPYAVEPNLTLAWFYHSHVDFSSDSVEPLCLKYIEKAISLNPLAPMLYNQQGRFYLEHAEQERKNGRDKMANIYEQRAKRSFQMVKELYPTYRDNKK